MIVPRRWAALAINFVFIASASFLFVPVASTVLGAATNDPSLGLTQTAGSAGFAVINTPEKASANLNALVGKIVRTILGLTGIIFLLIIVAAGDLWITSAGNEEKIGQARGMLFNAVIGLGITFAAYIAADTLICVGLEAAGIFAQGTCDARS